MILDIGCGTNNNYPAHPHGDVNCDIELPKTHIDNFVRCDAHCLPFKDGVFQKVISYHLIEHLCNVPKFINEIKRVLAHNGHIEIVTPNICHPNSWKDPKHLHHFNTKTLSKLFADFASEIRGDGGPCFYIKGMGFLFKKLPFLSLYFPSFYKNLKVLGTLKTQRFQKRVA